VAIVAATGCFGAIFATTTVEKDQRGGSSISKRGEAQLWLRLTDCGD